MRLPFPTRSTLARWGRSSLAWLGSLTKTSLGWLIPMLLTAGATAYISYVYNQKANTLLIIQQQKMADLQQFRSSGAQLDQALGHMSDALVDGKELESTRSEMRAAISKNITDADAVRHILGPGTDSYIDELAGLRTTIDEVHDVDSGNKLWADSLKLMSTRRKLLQSAEQHIFTS